MKKKDEKMLSEKEVYRLWWEYLKRSEKYRILWDAIISLNMDKQASSKLNNSQFNKIRRAYYANIDSDYYNLLIATSSWDTYITYCLLFGNVFQFEFEDVWLKGVMGKLRNSPATKLPVIDLNKNGSVKYIFSQDTYIKNSDEYLDGYLELEPKTMDIKKLIKSSVSYIFLGIPIVGTSNMKDISIEIKNIRDTYMKMEKTKVCDWVMKQAVVPSGYIRPMELKLYLDVYDLRKEGLTMPQIIKKLKPKQSGDSVNISRQFFSFQKKAKQIISNVEDGYFPGKY